MVLFILIVVGTFFFMEFVAWFTHKYIMHGILWSWHEDHHLPKYEKEGFFEKNDRFFLVFAIPSAASFMIGSLLDIPLLLAVGLGILLYGACYFLVHDVLIHKRFRWFRNTGSNYLKGLVKAHGAHHAKTTKEDGESFGMLVVPSRFFRKFSKKGSN